jgi:uncharacterized membrane protein YphA (DoxX/SURF4 family)
MRVYLNRRSIPERIVTGAFILHSGVAKWRGTPQQAAALHGLASAAYPVLRAIPPTRFLRLLAVGEAVTGAALLTPIVSDQKAGALLSIFSGALVTMYWRTPTLRKPGSIWPTPAGIAVSKDVWMLGIGAALLMGKRDALPAF